MIVTNNYEMTAGEKIEFSYNVEIPANVKYNSSTCYSVAAIALFLDTLRRDEREEILNVLNLKEKIT